HRNPAQPEFHQAAHEVLETLAYVLASSEKIGTASRFRVLPWEEISGLITDAGPGHPVVGQLAASGVEILTAG
ncbi:hypothetical protein ABT085_35980, partial [Streptomyces sp. NPDC002265]